MSKYRSFETKRLVLKPTSEEDAGFLLELLNTPKWLENIGDRNVNSIDDAQNYIGNRITPQFEELGYSSYTVVRKSDGRKLGVSGLYNREGVDGIDLGFALLPDYEMQGYAFESAQRIKEVALSYFNLSQLSAITSKHNKASQKLLEKLGFIMSEDVTLPNDDEKLLLYKLTLT